MLSIAIPSRNEKFLKQTILDVLANATGEIEIFPVLDGYEPLAEEIVHDPRVYYLRIPLGDGKCHKRQGINMMVEQCHGDYVMSLDAHCMMAKGFDVQLAKDHQPNWVQIPRRQRLDAENWCLQTQSDDRPPIDYEYIPFEDLLKPDVGIHDFKWDKRSREREKIMIDDTLTSQGSCWFMTKDWFRARGFMDLKYQGWGQEAEEINFETWKNGGEVKTNKNTWYAHLHKGPKYGRMYFMNRADQKKSYEYSIDYWLHKNKDFFIGLMEKWMPMPGWPDDWKEQLTRIEK